MGAPSSLNNINYTRMHYFEKKSLKFSPQRGPARMFPRVLLWLLTLVGRPVESHSRTQGNILTVQMKMA